MQLLTFKMAAISKVKVIYGQIPGYKVPITLAMSLCLPTFVGMTKIDWEKVQKCDIFLLKWSPFREILSN